MNGVQDGKVTTVKIVKIKDCSDFSFFLVRTVNVLPNHQLTNVQMPSVDVDSGDKKATTTEHDVGRYVKII